MKLINQQKVAFYLSFFAKIWHPLTFLILAFSGNTLLWSMITEHGRIPDEPSHFDYIRSVIHDHALPIYGQTYYLHRPDMLHAHASTPPLYYLLGVPIQIALLNQDVFWQILALRIYSVLLGSITVALTYFYGRILAPNRPIFALAVSALVGFNAMFTHISSGINSDNLANTVSVSLLLLLTASMQQKSLSRRWLIGLGTLLGIGALAKTTIVSAVFTTFLVLTWLAWQQPQKRFQTFLTYILWVGGIAFLLSGWYFVRNWLLYGDPTGLIFLLKEYHPIRGKPYSEIGSLWEMVFATKKVPPFIPTLYYSFWGVFGYFDFYLNERIYTLLNNFAIGGLLGALLWAIQKIFWALKKQAQAQKQLLILLPTAIITLSSLWSLLSASYGFTYSPQGRYLFAALPAFAVIFVGGWEQWAKFLKIRGFIAPFLLSLFLSVNLLALFTTVNPAQRNYQLFETLSYSGYTPQKAYNSALIQTSFVAQKTKIDRLELFLVVPPQITGTISWQLQQQNQVLLTAKLEKPAEGLGLYRLPVKQIDFKPSLTYTITLAAPTFRAEKPLLLHPFQGRWLQAVYPKGPDLQNIERIDDLIRPSEPSLIWPVRLLYLSNLILFLALAFIAFASLLGNRWSLFWSPLILGLLLWSLFAPGKLVTWHIQDYDLTPNYSSEINNK